MLGVLAWSGVIPATAQVGVERLANDRVKLSWEDAAGTLSLESTPALATDANWQPVPAIPVVQGTLRTLEIPVTEQTQFYRLTGPSGLFTVIRTFPAVGEAGISVNRETVFELSAPLGVEATVNGRVNATAAGRTILTRTDLSEDRRRVTLFYLENLPPGARVKVTFQGDGLVGAANQAADLDGDGVAGGQLVLLFDTVNTATLPNTAVTGRVLASEPGPGGADVPLAGVTITVDGREETVRAVTDANGFFRLQPAPTGRFFVNVDGRTATASQWPNGAYYPVIGKGWEAIGGKTNNLAGGTGIIYLPLVAAQTLGPVSATEQTVVTFPESVLTAMPELNGVEITVPPNALFADNGTRGGRVGLAPVASDRLPEPLPAGLTHALDISIQTDGPQNFDRPVAVKFPNLPDPVTGERLPAGAKTALWSFNHDTGRWEMQGPMTVTPDGLFVVSDPGVGIRQPGWHGTSPGSSGGGGPGGPPPPCTPGGLIPEGGTSCGEGDCPDLSEAMRQKSICLANGGAAAMKCYQKCGSSGPITGWLKVFSTAYKCAKAAGCSKSEAENAKKCADRWDPCIFGAGRQGRRAAPPDADAVAAAATAILDEIIVQGALWEQLAALMESAPSYEQLSAADRARFDTLAAELNARLGGVSPTEYFGARLTAFTALILSSPIADDVFPPVAGYYAVEDLESGLIRRGRTEPRGYLNGLILRPNTAYRISLLLGPALNFYQNEFASAGAGRPTTIDYGEALVPPGPDADGDGIPAAAEFVLGTSDAKADSDGDGVKDLDELRNRTNPLDGQPPVTGIVASLETPGNATDVALLRNVALVADGAAGVAIVDVTDPLRPALLQQVNTPGDAQAVALVDMIGAVADGTGGLAILDVADPVNPVVAAQLPLGGDARAVTADANTAHVGLADGRVVSVDLLAAIELGRLTLPGNPKIEDLALGDDYLYAWAAGRLHVIAFLGGTLTWLTSVDANVAGGQGSRRMRLTLSAGRAYAAYPAGVVVFDLADPAAPVLLQKRNTTQNGWKQLVPVLPGLAIAADGLNLVNDEPQDVSLYSLGADGTELNFLTGFVTPGVSHALVLDRGLAFLADGSAGLQVINFTPADTAGIPPTVELMTSFPSAPPEIESGQPGRVTAVANDDVAVRQVEFYVDNTLVAVDRAWPFEHRFVAPERTAARTRFTLRARAVDTAGNATQTPELTVQLLPDMTPPQVLAVAPGDHTVPDTVTSVLARFNEPLDFTTVTPVQVTLLSAGPDLVFGNADDQPRTGAVSYAGGSFAAVFDPTGPLPVGRYRFAVTGVRDLAGNPLATPLVSQFYVAPGGPGGDPDGDGLTNTEESLANTSPFTEDTDGDGWADEVEFHDGKDARDPGSRPQSPFFGKPLVSVLLEDVAEVLPTVPGPIVARPPAAVWVEPGEELAAAGPFIAHPPVEVLREADDELAPAGPWLARPPATLLRSSDAEEAPPGPLLGRPPVSARILPP